MRATARAAGLVFLLATLAVVSVATALNSRDQASPPRVISEPPPGLAGRRLLIPVEGIAPRQLRDNFDEMRGARRRHDALDIMAARGTRVLAVDDGRIAKLFHGGPGGRTIYQFDRTEEFAYYYAHLDAYAQGLSEGMAVKRGDVVGYVGSTGNAPPHAPHLHFTIFKLGPDKRWWKGKAVNPYPYLTEATR